MQASKLMILVPGLALAVSLAGCASHGYDKGSATASGLKDSAEKIQATSGKLDATLASLNSLVESPQADLRPQYKTFSDNVDDLGALAKHVADSVESMRVKSKEYFTQWDQELAGIRNEDIRNRSMVRKEEVMTALGKVKREYAESEIAFRPFMSDLRDIQKYLGTDLTAAGVATMKDAAARANKDGRALKESINELVGEFKSLGMAMSAAAPPPPPK